MTSKRRHGRTRCVRCAERAAIRERDQLWANRIFDAGVKMGWTIRYMATFGYEMGIRWDFKLVRLGADELRYTSPSPQPEKKWYHYIIGTPV